MHMRMHKVFKVTLAMVITITYIPYGSSAMDGNGGSVKICFFDGVCGGTTASVL